ncbi:GNAT family acetyltransferase [Marinobacterium zhoushanense]|uniref:GNAT family acetyltransferase n=1 Tax=Marinobacterium zhoushanense TaxID=1679163 RepID=A0ABQ1KLV7_9GAMM|nr:GNAT family N-acetyltransferase [Marinobacterium zhoushanense]GGC03229.1 GNAT family acetyltransferase [Marinobacterium zhoushanense]
MPETTIDWKLLSYSAFDLRMLEDWLALRQRVFVVEQCCAYADIDGQDRDALHLLGMEAGELIAGARLFQPKQEIPYSRIGRVVVAPEYRAGGLGRELMRRAMAECVSLGSEYPIRVSAQAHLRQFYASLDFVEVSGIYDEDGIPHIDMEYRRNLS